MTYLDAMREYKQKNASKIDETALFVRKRSVCLHKGDYALAQVYYKRLEKLWSSKRDKEHLKRTLTDKGNEQ